MKKLLTSLLCVMMVVCFMPAMAWADVEDSGGGTSASTSTEITATTTILTAGDYILNGDITLTNGAITIESGSTVTINLNGYSLKNKEGYHTIINNGTLTIEGEGTVDNVSPGKGALYNNAGATATLKGGTYTRSEEKGASAENNGGNSWYTIKNFGTMTINDGVEVVNNGSYSSLLGNGWQDGSTAGQAGKEPEVQNNGAKLIINGGTFTGGLNTIKNDDYGTLTINGGTFANVAQYAVMNWNVATINEGTFTSESCAVWNRYGADNMDQGKLTITGGTFNSPANYYVIFHASGDSGEVSISGGTYSNKYVSNLSVEDYIGGEVAPIIQSDGSCIIGQTNEEMPIDNQGYYYETTDAAESGNTAVIGDTYYRTLSAALAVAQQGETVKLLKDITLTAQLTLSKGITLDGGNHTITVNHNDETEANGGGILITTDDVTLQNVTVVGPNKGTDGTITWVSNQHTIKIWSGKNIKLENVTVENGSEAIQVGPDSELTLSGKINLVNNYYNGIELVKGIENQGGSVAGKLIVAAGTTIVNKDIEIWQDNVKDPSVTDNSGTLTKNEEGKYVIKTVTPSYPTLPTTPTVQKPVIELNADVTTSLSTDGTALTIKANDGYEITDVTVNGVSKGAVTTLTGLKTGDKIVITTKKIETPDDNTALIEAVKNTKLIARSAMSTAKGKKAVKVSWYAADGSDLDFDGYEVFRSLKRYSGFGTTPIFKTSNEKYYNTAIKKGNKYYYKVRAYKVIDGEKVYTDWSTKAWRTVK